VKERLESKKQFEEYIGSMKNSISDDYGLKSKLPYSDVATIEDNLKEAEEWIESNPEADKDDLEYHLKELQKVCDPIIAKVYKT
jgi:heat shock protein 5